MLVILSLSITASTFSAREPRTGTSWGMSEHSERIPPQAKCPRPNIRERGLQSERKKRTVGRAASAMSGHYAHTCWLARGSSLSDSLGDPAAPGRRLSLPRETPTTFNKDGPQVRSESCEHVQRGDSRERNGHVMSAGSQSDTWRLRAPRRRPSPLTVAVECHPE